VDNGYFFYADYKIAWPYDSNCQNQVAPGNCLQCRQQSQFINSGIVNLNGKCVKYQANCNSYDSNGICSACQPGYLFYLGQCFINNCQSVSSTDNVCSSCPNNFIYQAGICYNRVQNNCIVYSTTSSANASCLYCASAYYLTAINTCQLMISNCLVTNVDTGRCTSCISGYSIYQ
jgi:hypothetical protein